MMTRYQSVLVFIIILLIIIWGFQIFIFTVNAGDSRELEVREFLPNLNKNASGFEVASPLPVTATSTATMTVIPAATATITVMPTVIPAGGSSETSTPTPQPARTATPQATASPTAVPTAIPTASSTPKPTLTPTVVPTATPTAARTPFSIPLPSAEIKISVSDGSDSYVGGSYTGNKTGYFVARFDSSGMNMRWINAVDGPNYDHLSKDGLAYYEGKIYALWGDDYWGVGSADVFFSVLDSKDGVELWREKIASGSLGITIAVDSNGVYAAFYSDKGVLVRFSQDSANSWIKTWTLALGDLIVDIALNDVIYLTGNIGNDVFTAKYDQDRTMVWYREWGTPVIDLSENLVLYSEGIKVSGIVISGLSVGEKAYACDFLLEYALNGTLLSANDKLNCK